MLGEYGPRLPALGSKAARARCDEIAAGGVNGKDPIAARKLVREQQAEALVNAPLARDARVAENARKQAEAAKSSRL